MDQLHNKLVGLENDNIPSILVTVVEKFGDGPVEVGKKMLVTEDKTYGTVGGGALEYQAIEHSKKLLEEKESVLVKYVLNEGQVVTDATTLPMACGGRVSLFYDYIGVKGHIYIFGAGHVSQALTNVLKTMNYHITVIDYREDVCDKFQGADLLVNSQFVDYIENEGIKKNSYIIVCTPSHKYDYDVIDSVLKLDIKPKYMGMLCSKKKLRDYLDKTYKTYGRDIDLSNFYAPIGLDTGGGSPEEIAISIAAEILAVQNNKKYHKHMNSGLY